MEKVKEIINKLNKEQKVAGIVLVLVMAVIVIGISINSSKTNISSSKGKTTEDKVREFVDARVKVEIVLTYSGTPTVNITKVEFFNDLQGRPRAMAYGKVDVRDNYGDIYTAKFTAEVNINDGDSISLVDLDMDTPTKSRF